MHSDSMMPALEQPFGGANPSEGRVPRRAAATMPSLRSSHAEPAAADASEAPEAPYAPRATTTPPQRRSMVFRPCVDAIPTYVDAVMEHVGEAFDGPGARIALSEALLNAIVHGALSVDTAGGPRDPEAVSRSIARAERACPPERSVTVEVEESGSDAPLVLVRDPGAGFDWLPAAIRAARCPEPDAPGGRGLHLLRMGAAGVDWNEPGNEVRLRLRRADQPRTLSPLGFMTAPTIRPQPPTPRPPVGARVHRILVVDDDAVTRHVVQRVLSQSGFAVEQAPSGSAALARFAERLPDAVVLDLEMPGLSGIDVLERLRDRGLLMKCPVVLLTATEPTAEVRARALEAGASTFLVKPITSRELVAQLRRTIETQERIAVLGAERDGLRESESRVAGLLAALSPPRDVARALTRIESRVVPAASIGGDLFDLVDIRPGLVAAMLVDVAGKGGPAAMTAAAIRWLARDRFKSTAAIGPTFQAINERLYDDFDATRQHAAVSAVIVDEGAGMLHVANSGNPPIVVVPWEGEPAVVASATPPLGVVPRPRVRVESFLLREVAHVIAPSDGLTECFGSPTDTLGALETLVDGPLRAGIRCPDVERAVSWATARDDASLLFISFSEEVAS